jgi:hypothetical protein
MGEDVESLSFAVPFRDALCFRSSRRIPLVPPSSSLYPSIPLSPTTPLTTPFIDIHDTHGLFLLHTIVLVHPLHLKHLSFLFVASLLSFLLLLTHDTTEWLALLLSLPFFLFHTSFYEALRQPRLLTGLTRL